MTISSKELRSKFLQHKKKTSFKYMGVNIADSETKKGDSFNHFYLPENTPTNFSPEAKDLFGRIVLNLNKLKNSNWGLLFLKEGSEENYDEFEMCQVQLSQTELTQEEKDVIEPLFEELSTNWSLAIRVENVYSYLEELKNKYHNQYAYPKSETSNFINLVEAYLTLMKDAEDNEMAQRKIEETVLQNIAYLDSKILLPDLRVKYPTLFK
eukprot:gene7779-12253_t